jgi:hypothetical protein
MDFEINTEACNREPALVTRALSAVAIILSVVAFFVYAGPVGL